MRIEWDKKQKNPRGVTIIGGFPGFGLVGTISTEYLIDHLAAKQIGRILIKNIAPVVAVHQGSIVEPIGIFYNKKYNLIIIHTLTSISGIEWELAEGIQKIANELKAKEVISLEGVSAPMLNKEPKAYYLTTKSNGFKKLNMDELKEGIVMGVTGALLLRKGLNTSCIFAETHSELPDSRAAAKVIEILDKYLGLKVDYKPLIKKAEDFERKLKAIVSKSKMAMKTKKEKELSYFG